MVCGTFRLYRAPFAKSVPAVFCGISSDLFGAPSANWITLRCGLTRPWCGFLCEFGADAGSRICRGRQRCRRPSLDRQFLAGIYLDALGMPKRAGALFARPAAGWVSSGQGRCLGRFVSEVVAELASADVDGFFASLA